MRCDKQANKEFVVVQNSKLLVYSFIKSPITPDLNKPLTSIDLPAGPNIVLLLNRLRRWGKNRKLRSGSFH